MKQFLCSGEKNGVIRQVIPPSRLATRYLEPDITTRMVTGTRSEYAEHPTDRIGWYNGLQLVPLQRFFAFCELWLL